MESNASLKQTPNVEERAKLSGGTSADAIYRMVRDAIQEFRLERGGTLLDVGCGQGQLWPFVQSQFDRYVGADVVRYPGFPEGAEFCRVDLDSGRIQFPAATADVVVAVETIEHLENPWAFIRELTRLVKPGGWVLVTTPNQLSLLSKLGLLIKNEFPNFRSDNLPHVTALIERDLRRMGSESGWRELRFRYSKSGRIPGTAKCWPGSLSRRFPRTFSDNLLAAGQTDRSENNPS